MKALLAAATLQAAARAAAAGELPWLVSTADSMTNVRRNFEWYAAGSSASSPAMGARLEVAQNEVESIQVVITAPGNRPAANITWRDAKGRLLGLKRSIKGKVVSGLFDLVHNTSGRSFPLEDVDLAPYGFIHQGPCPFDALDGTCPAERPYHCKYNNDSWRANPPSPCTPDPDHCQVSDNSSSFPQLDPPRAPAVDSEDSSPVLPTPLARLCTHSFPLFTRS
jgi:hypothetical protein